MKKSIEEVRVQLNKALEKGETSLYSEDILEISRQLDDLISDYMHLLNSKNNKKKHKSTNTNR